MRLQKWQQVGEITLESSYKTGFVFHDYTNFQFASKTPKMSLRSLRVWEGHFIHIQPEGTEKSRPGWIMAWWYGGCSYFGSAVHQLQGFECDPQGSQWGECVSWVWRQGSTVNVHASSLEMVDRVLGTDGHNLGFTDYRSRLFEKLQSQVPILVKLCKTLAMFTITTLLLSR